MGALLYLVAVVATLLIVRRYFAMSRRAAAALGLIPLCLTGRALLTGRVYAPIDLAYNFDPLASMARTAGVESIANPMPSDVVAQFIPWHAAVRWSLQHGQWPLWNPFELCGNILAGAAQSAPFHPVTLLSLLLPLPDAFGFIASMTYFLAALGMFVFLRDHASLRRPLNPDDTSGGRHVAESAALAGAAGWALSTYVVGFTGTAHGAAIALLPLVMFGAQRLRREPSVQSTALLCGTLVLLTLCGHPETSLHVIALASVSVLAFVRRDRLARTVAGGVAAGIAALLLTAFFLAPLIEALPQTQEFAYRQTATASAAAPWHVAGHTLITTLVPFAGGIPGMEEAEHASGRGWLPNGYAGALLLAPAAFALARLRKRERRFYGGVLAVGILAGGQAPILTHALARLPLFAISVNARMISFAAFAVCVLGAIGIDAAAHELRTLARGFLAVAAVLAIVIFLTVPSTLTPDFVRANAIRELAPLLLASLMLTAFPDRRGAAGLVGLLLVQRTAEIGAFIPTVERRAFFPAIPGFDRLPRDGEPYRIVAQGPLFPPGASTLYGLEDVRGYQAMTFAPLAQTFTLWSVPQPVWSNRVDDLTAPMLTLMNVRYAMALVDAPVPPGWRRVGRYPGYRLLENEHFLARAFIPRTVHLGAPDSRHAMATTADFANDAWIGSRDTPATVPNGSGSLTVRKRGARLLIHASMRSDAWVVISESAWKGWQVTMDGRERLKIHRADHAFLGVRVPAGDHELEVVYWPRGVTNSLIVSAAAALLLGAFWIARELNHRDAEAQRNAT